MEQLTFVLGAAGIALSIFTGMLLMIEVGRRVGLNAIQRYGPEAASAGVGIVDGAMYALLALLIGFTFSGAAARFDGRRTLMGEELNSIGTAWQRIELLPAAAQAPIRDEFRRYVDALVNSYTKPRGAIESLHESTEEVRTQAELWKRAVAACTHPDGEKARMLLLPALNELFGLVERERTSRRIHPPLVIFVMLGITALTAAMFAGYGMAAAPARNWIYIIGVAAAIAVSTYVIIDLEFPRLGLIRVDAFDRSLVELRASLQ